MNHRISSLVFALLVAMILGFSGAALAQDSGGAAPTIVDLNVADAATLTSLPGIGEARAQAIVEHRAAHGGFERIEDLTVIRGIGDAMVEKLRDRITVSVDRP